MRIATRRAAARLAFAAGIGLGLLHLQPLVAAPLEFDFKDPKGVNAVSFTLDSEVEPIVGYASGVSGTVSFDPGKPEATTGSIVVDAATMTVSNSMMTDIMRGDQCLDVAKYPTMTFVFKSVEAVEKKSDARWVLTVKGDFTVHGVTKEMTVPVDVSYLADKAPNRLGEKVAGDLMVLRAEFMVNRVDVGVMAAMGPEMVAHEIDVKVGVVGLHKK